MNPRNTQSIWGFLGDHWVGDFFGDCRARWGCLGDCWVLWGSPRTLGILWVDPKYKPDGEAIQVKVFTIALEGIEDYLGIAGARWVFLGEPQEFWGFLSFGDSLGTTGPGWGLFGLGISWRLLGSLGIPWGFPGDFGDFPGFAG